MNADADKRTEIAIGPPPAPSARMDDEFEPPRSIRSDDASAMQVFFAWEKLRIIYNIVLVAIVLVMCGRAIPFIIGEALASALAANLMFCAGPVAECYLHWLGVPRVPARVVLFALGLLMSMALTMWASAIRP